MQSSRSRLAEDNRTLRNALLIIGARNARLQAAAEENARLRGLLGAAQRGRLDVQLAPILDIDLDPTRQRLVLDLGSRDGVSIGQSVIDAGGLLGQIIAVTPTTATVLLLTDPDHAVPVAVARSGVRLVAYGRGDRLELANVPLSSDVKAGDAVVTSGLGGRFPAGFPVGTIGALRPDDSRAFLVGALTPAAQLDRGRDVLLLRNVDVPGVAPPPAAARRHRACGPTGIGSKGTPPQPSPAVAGEGADTGADSMSRLRNQWVLPVSVFVALLLGLLPLPELLQPLRPYWLALVVAYWVIEAPDRAGLGFAFALGLIADVAFGGLLGEQALRLVVMTFILQRFRSQLRFFPLSQQALAIGGLLLNDRVVSAAVHLALGEPQLPWTFWWAPLLGMLLWAPLFLMLDALRLDRRRG